MSNFIRVNHSQFESTAKAIDTYISRHNSSMAAAGQVVATLAQQWQGKDATQFQQKWGKLNDKSSTPQNMMKSLEAYADFLRFAASQYKAAQSKAVNRANWL